MNEWITVKEFCSRYPFWSERTVRKRLEDGEMPGIRPGKKWFISTNEIEQYFEEQKNGYKKIYPPAE